MQAILDQLRSEDPEVAGAAAMELAQSVDIDPAFAVPLLQAISSQHESVREWSAEALENLGAPRTSALAPLAEIVGDYLAQGASLDSAYWALVLISRLGPDGLGAIDLVTSAAEKAEDSSVREKAVFCLGRMGPEAASALPILNRLANDDSARLARLAARAIGQISG